MTIAFYADNKPTNQLFSLSPLASASNPKDIDSITTRLAGSPRVTSPFYFGTTFDANSTNAPTMTAGSASKTIGSIFMNDASNGDEIGIRGTSGANLAYNTNGTFRWFGAGIMSKPIRDFYLVDPVRFPQLSPGGTRTFRFETSSSSPYFPYFLGSGDGVTISANDFFIPEPAEYALVFGLFALGFVIFMKYKVQQNGKRKQTPKN